VRNEFRSGASKNQGFSEPKIKIGNRQKCVQRGVGVSVPWNESAHLHPLTPVTLESSVQRIFTPWHAVSTS
jgi:hypothetical protein